MKHSVIATLLALLIFTKTANAADVQKTIKDWMTFIQADAKESALEKALGKPDSKPISSSGGYYEWYGAVDDGTKIGASLYVWVKEVNGVLVVLWISPDGGDRYFYKFPWTDSALGQ